MKLFRNYVILFIVLYLCLDKCVNGQLLSSLMNFLYRGQKNAALEDLDESKDGSRTQFDFIIVGAGNIKYNNLLNVVFYFMKLM